MVKRRRRPKIKSVRWFVSAAVIIMVLLTGAILLIGRNRQKKEEQKLYSQTIPPYYDKKAFERPKDVKQSPLVVLERRVRIPIIMYHYVEYVKDGGDLVRQRLNINPYIFESELTSLKENGYETYFVKDVPSMLDGTLQIAKKSVVLTFDDGYEDFYTYALPLLKKYQIKATIYIVYDFIGRKGFLNETELKEIAASNLVEIGSHTLDHVGLKQMQATFARAQVIDSKKKLENLLGTEIKTFAYPYGSFGQDTIDLVKEAGYTAAVSVIPGVYQIKDNLFYLSRVRAGALSGLNAAGVLESLKK